MAVAAAQSMPIAPEGKPFSLLIQRSEGGGTDFEFGISFGSLESAKETVTALIQLGHIHGALILEEKGRLIRAPRVVA